MKAKFGFFVGLSLLPLFFQDMRAEVKLPKLFSDNLILQRKSKVAIWGWATHKSTVSISPSWTQKATITTADAQEKCTVNFFIGSPRNLKYHKT